MNPKYNIVSKGEIVSGFTCDCVKQNIASLLKLKPAQVDHICLGDPVVLKANVELVLAQKIQKALFEKGLKVHIVEQKSVETADASGPVKSNVVTKKEKDHFYDVVSKGEIITGFNCDVVKQTVGALLKLKSAQIDRICSGALVVLQSNIDLELAKKIQKALFNKGLKVHVVEKNTEQKKVPEVSNRSPSLPKASHIELSLSRDHEDLSEGVKAQSSETYDQLLAKAPAFELVNYEYQEEESA